MTKAELIKAAKLLNATVYEDEEKDNASPLIAKKIKITDVKEADLLVAFKGACESIPEELEQHLPDAVSNVYNALGEQGWILENGDPAQSTTAMEEVIPETKPAAKPTKPAIPKEVKVAKVKFTRGDALLAALKKGGDTETICANLDIIYSENGGKSNPQEAKWIMSIMLPMLIKVNAVVAQGDKFKANF